MENLLTVAFEAHSQEENHHRRMRSRSAAICSMIGRFPSVRAAPARVAETFGFRILKTG